MTSRQAQSPYLSKPLRSLEEVLRERRLGVGHSAAVSHGGVKDMPPADNSNAPGPARLRGRPA